MLTLYIVAAFTISVVSSAAVPLMNCTAKDSNVSMFDMFEPFGVWHTIAIASAENHDGLNSLTISLNDEKNLFLHIDWKGICTKIEKIFYNTSGRVYEDKWDYIAINWNTDYVILHHHDHRKCATNVFLLLGKHSTASGDIMESFKGLVDCSNIPELTIYTLPQEDGICKISTPQK